MFDGSSLVALLLFLIDKLPYEASLVASLWVFLRVYDYVRYVRPKMIREAQLAPRSDPTEF